MKIVIINGSARKGNTLTAKEIEKPSFVVDSLIPTGLSLFCGSQKIGKSWLIFSFQYFVCKLLP